MELKTYVGAKIIQARPMNKLEFMQLTGKDMPVEVKTDGETEEGYLVVYPPDRYQSWSPKAVFENAYREVTFGEKQMII